jgi:hypothetical protein
MLIEKNIKQIQILDRLVRANNPIPMSENAKG